MISCWLSDKLLSLLTLGSFELNLRFLLLDVDVARLDELLGDFTSVACVFRSLWDERFFRFGFGFERLQLLLLRNENNILLLR